MLDLFDEWHDKNKFISRNANWIKFKTSYKTRKPQSIYCGFRVLGNVLLALSKDIITRGLRRN